MGHVPSAELCVKPLMVDLLSSKNQSERLACVALTRHNFPSADDPLFAKFCAVRSENPVRHWYCRPASSDPMELPDAPTPKELYHRMVEAASLVVDKKLKPSQFTPLPVMLAKMDDPTTHELPNGSNCSVVGYFGLRCFNLAGEVGEEGVMGIFLSTKFYNEAKSICCIQIACKCYQYFSAIAAGVDPGSPDLHTPWPLKMRYDTIQSNLPCLRLTQKLHALVEAHDIRTENALEIIKEGNRVFFKAWGEVFIRGAELLAGRILPEEDPETGETRLVLRPETVPNPQPTDKVAELAQLIANAKERWSDANAAVVKRQLQQSRATRRKPLDNENSPQYATSTSIMDHPAGSGKTSRRKGSTGSASGSTTGVTLSRRNSIEGPPSPLGNLPSAQSSPIPIPIANSADHSKSNANVLSANSPKSLTPPSNPAFTTPGQVSHPDLSVLTPNVTPPAGTSNLTPVAGPLGTPTGGSHPGYPSSGSSGHHSHHPYGNPGVVGSPSPGAHTGLPPFTNRSIASSSSTSSPNASLATMPPLNPSFAGQGHPFANPSFASQQPSSFAGAGHAAYPGSFAGPLPGGMTNESMPNASNLTNNSLATSAAGSVPTHHHGMYQAGAGYPHSPNPSITQQTAPSYSGAIPIPTQPGSHHLSPPYQGGPGGSAGMLPPSYPYSGSSGYSNQQVLQNQHDSSFALSNSSYASQMQHSMTHSAVSSSLPHGSPDLGPMHGNPSSSPDSPNFAPNLGAQYPLTPHHPRQTIPLRRSSSNAVLEQTQPWSTFRGAQPLAVGSNTSSRRSSKDYRVFLGEQTPVYVCTDRRQWEPMYWRNPLSPVQRSTWQPHLDAGFICYECDHADLSLYDAFWRPVVQPTEALLFLEANEEIWLLDETGNYIKANAM
jgi:hypothetical protein